MRLANDVPTRGGAKVILLDRILAEYGPESHQTRADLRQGIVSTVRQIWGKHAITEAKLTSLEGSKGMEQVGDDIRALVPVTEAQHSLLSQAEQIQSDLMGARWLIVEEQQTALPNLFLIVLIFLHMGRVFFFGAYKYPRELSWIIGVVLLAGDDEPARREPKPRGGRREESGGAK